LKELPKKEENRVTERILSPTLKTPFVIVAARQTLSLLRFWAIDCRAE
jgi:hypothetical protein